MAFPKSEAVRYLLPEFPKVSIPSLGKAIKSGKPYYSKYYVREK